jgi:hypothetical protein
MKRVLTALALLAVLGNGLTIASKTFQDGKPLHLSQVYYQCGGDNISPDINWTDLPDGTKYIGIVIWDPDAPKKGGWYHWVIVNIPAEKGGVPAGAGSPQSPNFRIGIQFPNDYGEIGYGGPCPPPGEIHHYRLTLYALPDRLDVSWDTPTSKVLSQLQKEKIGEKSITALYKGGWK